MGIECFRGSEDDVIGRVCGAMRAFDVEIHAEFMGDNSIPDARVIDHVIDTFLARQDSVDYVTNALKTTYPPGLEVSVYRSFNVFDAESKTIDGDIREYCGFHIYTHPERYRILNLEAPEHQRRPHLHLEVDTEEDFEVVAAVYRHFGDSTSFTLDDVVSFAEETPSFCEELTRRTTLEAVSTGRGLGDVAGQRPAVTPRHCILELCSDRNQDVFATIRPRQVGCRRECLLVSSGAGG